MSHTRAAANVYKKMPSGLVVNEKAKALVFTSLGHYLNDTFLILLSILIVYYLLAGISAIFLAVMSAIYGIISGLLSTPVGSIADRRGNYAELMLLGFILIGAANLSFALSFMSYNVYFIALGSVLLGSGAAFYHPLGGSILQIKYGGKNAPKALGLNGSMGSLGRAIAPTLLVLIIAFFGEEIGLTLTAAFVFALAGIIYAGLKDMRVNPGLKDMRVNPGLKDMRVNPGMGRQQEKASSPLRPYFYLLLPIAIMVFVRSMFITGVMMYVPTFMTDLYRSKTVMGLVLTVSYSMAIVSQPYFGGLTSRMGGKSVLIITTVGAAASFMIFLLIRSFYAQVALFAAYSFFAFTGFPNLIGYVGQLVDRGALTRANGVIWGMGNTVGGAIGVLIGGSLISAIGLPGVMWVFAIFAAASVALLPLLPKRKAG